MWLNSQWSQSWMRHKKLKINICLNGSFNSQSVFNASVPRQTGRHFTDTFLYESCCILIQILMGCPIDYKPLMLQMMSWCRLGTTSHYMAQWCHSLLTHICITMPRCVKQQKRYVKRNRTEMLHSSYCIFHLHLKALVAVSNLTAWKLILSIALWR